MMMDITLYFTFYFDLDDGAKHGIESKAMVKLAV